MCMRMRVPGLLYTFLLLLFLAQILLLTVRVLVELGLEVVPEYLGVRYDLLEELCVGNNSLVDLM